MRNVFVFSAMLATTCLGCAGSIPLVTVKSVGTSKVPVGAAKRVVIETANGEVKVSASKSGEVIAKITKHAGGIDAATAQRILVEIEAELVASPDEISLIVKKAGNRSGNWGADIEIEIPAGLVLQLGTTNGDITVVDATADVSAKSTNGDISLKTAAESNSKSFELATTNGSINVHSSVPIVTNATTTNGEIEFKGAPAQGRTSLESSNGSITITLVDANNFHFKLSTTNGSVENDFASTGRNAKSSAGFVPATQSSTETDITATTTNGNIALKKAN